MTEELLPYYNRELAFLRRMSAEFAAAHPKVAGRLRLGPDSVDDPHVERLIESTALLNARISHKLEDDFPELTDALLGVLYPHYLAPIPSMAIVQFEPAPDLTEGFVLPRGTQLETDRVHGESCRYRTSTETTVLPLSITKAALTGSPFDAPPSPAASTSVAALRLTVESQPDGPPLSSISRPTLRMFLGGQPQHALALYELLLNDVVEVALATSPQDRRPVILPPNCLHPVGLGDEEGLLPYPRRSLPGYRLLTEYFAFPAKFLFVDLVDLPLPETAESHVELYFFLRRTSVELQQNVGPDNFVLGCAPVVNLFEKRAEPTRLAQTEPEVRVVPDARRPLAMEVYSINSASKVAADGAQVTFSPFYGIDHQLDAHADGAHAFYHATRRPAAHVSNKTDRGTEVHLQLVDLDFHASAEDDAVLMVETTCLNRDLPGELPFGGDQPRLALTDGGAQVERVRCLTAPTPTRRPKSRDGARWKLISHLSLNHLSITGGAEGTRALKEILRLYEFASTEAGLAIIDSLLEISSKPATLRITSGVQAGFCRGTEVRIHVDESRFSDHGLFLFATVLEAFLASYCSINSFVQTVVTTNAREGELRRWPPRAGTGPLL